MTAELHRRQFLSATASAFAALSLSGCMTRGAMPSNFAGYGPLVPDPQGLLDLPEGFSFFPPRAQEHRIPRSIAIA